MHDSLTDRVEAAIAKLKSEDDDTRCAGDEDLKAIGPAAIPVLETMLDDPARRGMALSGLLCFGEVAAPLIPKILRFPWEDTLYSQEASDAADAVAIIAGNDVTPLLNHLRSCDDDEVGFCRNVLIIRMRAPVVIPALAAALRETDYRFQLRLLACLYGTVEEKPAIPVLLELLGAPQADVRREAARALGQIGSSALPGLRTLLESSIAHVREASLHAMTQYVGKLFELERRNLGHRCWIGTIMLDSENLLALFQAKLEDSSVAVRLAAATALHRVVNLQVEEVLCDVLWNAPTNEADPIPPAELSEMLRGLIGLHRPRGITPASRRALRSLIYSEEGLTEVREAAAAVLLDASPEEDPEVALPVLQEALKDSTAPEWFTYIRDVGRIGRAAAR